MSPENKPLRRLFCGPGRSSRMLATPFVVRSRYIAHRTAGSRCFLPNASHQKDHSVTPSQRYSVTEV